MVTKDEMFAEFERAGEDIVRERLIGEAYGTKGLPGSFKAGFAEEWLRLRDEARRDASNTEQIRTARSAKNAAWTAAIAAMIATICTIITIVITILR